MPVPALVLRFIFQEMAEETLLASARVRPQRLLDAGFQFKHPTLNDALSAVLAER
jgi:NAD dependent epimerase/dehydratase family enzyme